MQLSLAQKSDQRFTPSYQKLMNEDNLILMSLYFEYYGQQNYPLNVSLAVAFLSPISIWNNWIARNHVTSS